MTAPPSAPILDQLRASGVIVPPGAEPGTVQLSLPGPPSGALRSMVRDRAALREALAQGAAAAADLARSRRWGREVLRHAAAVLGEPPPDALGTRRGGRRAQLAANPSRALYLALGSAAKADSAEAVVRVAELVRGAARQELEARCPGQPVQGGLVRLGDTEGPGALQVLFLAAPDRLRPPAVGS